MRLYLFPPAPFSRKVLLAMYERGITLDLTVVRPFDAEAKNALRRIHPIASLPLLVTDAGLAMPESSVIVEYLDLITPGDRLLPTDPVQALPMRAFDRYGDQLLTATQYLAFAMRKPEGTRNTSRIESNLRTVREVLGILNQELMDREFLMGERLTFADLGPLCAIASLLSDGSIDGIGSWPQVDRWFKGSTARASWLRIIEDCKEIPLPPGFVRP